MVEDLVPLASLHQTDEPVLDCDDALDSEPDRHRDIYKVSRYMKMMANDSNLDPIDTIAEEYDDDFVESDDEYYEYEDVGNYASRSNDYSTDDSTDSGASIDSGGVSTKPKRVKFRRRKVSNYDYQSKSQGLALSEKNKLGLVVFSKQPSGEMKRIIVSNQPSVKNSAKESNSMWCRKAVASGSTKRACITAYSGTEDSGLGQNEEINQVSLGVHHSNALNIHQTQPLIPMNSDAVSNTSVNSTNNRLQYVILKPNTSTQSLNMNLQSTSLAKPNTTPINSSTNIVCFTNPNVVNNIPISLATSVYSVQIPNSNVMPTYVSSSGAKVNILKILFALFIFI